MVERIKKLGVGDEVIGGRISSGFTPQEPTQPLQRVFAGFEAVEKNNRFHAIRAEKAKEKALKGYLATIDVDFKTNLDVYAAESPRNAQAIRKKGNAYLEGMVSSAPLELQSLLRAKGNNYLNVKIANANAAATVEIQAQNDATEKRLASRDFLILNEASAGIYSENVDVRNASEVEMQSLQRELATRLFAKDVDDFGVPFDLLSKDVITGRLQNFRDVSQSAAIKSWFREQPDPDKAYLQLKRGGFKVDLATYKKNPKDGTVEESIIQVNVMDALSGEARDKMFQEIASEIKSINDISIKDEAQETESNKTAQSLNAFDNWDNLTNRQPGEPPLTTEMIRQQVAANLLAKDDGIALIKALNKPDAIGDNPFLVDRIERLIDLGEDASMEINGGFTDDNLTAETAADLRTSNRTRQDKAISSIVSAVDATRREAISDLNAGLKVNTELIIRDKRAGPRQVEARQDFRRRFDELTNEAPVETAEEFEIFREKSNKLVTEMIKTHRFKRNLGGVVIPSVVVAVDPSQVTMEKLTEATKTLMQQKSDGNITDEDYNKKLRDIMQLIQIENDKKLEEK